MDGERRTTRKGAGAAGKAAVQALKPQSRSTKSKTGAAGSGSTVAAATSSNSKKRKQASGDEDTGISISAEDHAKFLAWQKQLSKGSQGNDKERQQARDAGKLFVTLHLRLR